MSDKASMQPEVTDSEHALAELSEALSPVVLKNKILRELFQDAVEVYRRHMYSMDPKISYNVAHDVLEWALALRKNEPLGGVAGDQYNFMVPAEWAIKVASGLRKLREAEVQDAEIIE